jgi:hypothetical protein
MDVKAPFNPGTVVLKGRKVGVVLDYSADRTQVQVVAASGVEWWPVEKVSATTRPTATATGIGYAARALESAKAQEVETAKALDDYGEAFAKRKRLIEKIAHKEGPAHGIGRGLDVLLSNSGLKPRPLLVTRFLALLVQFTYNGTSSALSDSSRSPLYADRYATSGHYVPEVVGRRVVVFDLAATGLSFNDMSECTCGTEVDLPSREEAARALARVSRWDNWTTEVLDHKLLYVSGGGINCDHAAATGRNGQRVEAVFPDAPAWVTATEPSGDFRVGDLVEVVTGHWAMQPGWQFTINRIASDGALYGGSPDHVENLEWHLHAPNIRRVNPRIGDEVVLHTASLGLRPSTRLKVISPPYQAPDGLRVNATLADGSDNWVYTVHVARMNLAANTVIEADDEEDDEPF